MPRLTRYVFCTNESPHIRESTVGVWVRYEDARAELDQLRGNLTLAEDGLAAATQEIERLQRDIAERDKLLEAAARATQLADERAQALERIQQERLTWAMACECNCTACEKFSSVIRRAGGTSEPGACAYIGAPQGTPEPCTLPAGHPPGMHSHAEKSGEQQ